ncbi:MAG TPA: ABC transporter permease [Methylomirabilota bacterium]|nr:ABC transporter permease [Methylomirabilota bacterium]
MTGSLLLEPVRELGRLTIDALGALGRFGVFLGQALFWLMIPPFKFQQFLHRISFIGVRSMSIILLTGGFTGMVLGLQGVLMLRRVGSEAFVGAAVAVSLVRELGPVLSALMVTGRAGSALAAELGVMRITEQIDALTVMALNPFRYLVVPTLVAGVVAMPILVWLFDVIGIFGGYLVVVQIFGLSGGTYFGQIQSFLSTTDIWVGFWKSLAFGVIVTWVACYKGFHVGHGAEGVGRATTESVVLASVLIFVLDYFMGSVLP